MVSKAFKHGQDAFDLRLLPREVESTPLYDQPPALQHGTLALGVPPCEKPSQDLLLGTLSEPGIYSLHPCECFGAAYASVEPVHEDSDAAVPRNPQGYFNNGSAPKSVRSNLKPVGLTLWQGSRVFGSQPRKQ